ncbi:MAG: AI-2E family transporter [Bacteroidota bacterium]
MTDPTGRYFRIILLLLVLGGALYFLVSIGDIVRLLVIAALLAYILDPIATELEAAGLNRLLATGIVFIGVGLSIFLVGFFVVPALVREIQNLQASASATQTSALISSIENYVNEKLSFFGMQQINLDQKIQEAKLGISDQILGQLVTNVVPFVAHAVIIPFVIFFLLKDGREMKKALLSVIPNRYFEFSLNLFYKMDQQLGFYLRGQFVDALIFGIISTMAMWMLGVKYFVFIGIFAGLANLIPYVGPLAGAILASSLTILTTGDISRVISVIVAFGAVKLIDDAVIQPLVIARSVDMHPLLVLFVVIIGGQFFGVMGMILSVPFAGFVRVAIQESRLIIRRYKFG